MISVISLKSIIRSEFRESYLSSKKMTIFSFSVFLLEVILFGNLIGYAYYLFTTTTILDNQPSLKSLFLYVQLTVFGYMFFIGLLNSIFGYTHPFFMSNKLTHLSSRIPFDSDILYLSALGKNLMKVVLLSIFYNIIFLPIHILGKFSVINIILTIFVLFNGFAQLVVMINLIFFLTKPIRRKFSSIEKYGEGNNVMMIIVLAPLVLSFFGLTEDWYPSFTYMSHWVLLPIINTAFAFTGLFLRSGIPSVAIYGMISQLVITSVCLGINVKLSRSYEYEDEIVKMMANFSISEARQQQLRSMNSMKVPLYENLTGGTFPPSKLFQSLLYKDYLAINRSKTGHRFFMSSVLSLPIVWYLVLTFHDQEYRMWVFLLLIVVLSSFIQIILASETDLHEITRLSKNTLRMEKVILFCLMNLIFLSPLFMVNIWFTLVFDIMIAFILGWFYETSFFASLYGRIFISFLYLIQLGVITAFN